jgi:hypothetical protein
VNPITHGLAAWVCLANAHSETTRRERVIITVGGLIPDIDGLGAVPDILTRWFTDSPTGYFQDYHHDLHTALFAAIATAGAAALARGDVRARVRTAALFFVAFHLHLLCDVIGSRGPDGSIWDVPYWRPFTEAGHWEWSGQWRLDGWQNVCITIALLTACGVLAVRRGRTIVEVLSTRVDGVIVETVRRRFGGQRPADLKE